MRRLAVTVIVALFVGVTALAIARWGAIQAHATSCPTREEAVTVVSHKSDVEHGEPAWLKYRILAIMERESGLQHCTTNGAVKVSATNDHGALQVNPAGVWRNCAVNPWCSDPAMLDDFGAQVDLILTYYDRYHDLCPWNPAGRYNPGCGY